MLNSEATLAELKEKKLPPGPWQHIRFRRGYNAEGQPEGYVLYCVPVEIQNALYQAFYHRKARKLSETYPMDKEGKLLAFHFQIGSGDAGNMAVLFPCGVKDTPLLVGKKGAVLFGAARRAVETAFNLEMYEMAPNTFQQNFYKQEQRPATPEVKAMLAQNAVTIAAPEETLALEATIKAR